MYWVGGENFCWGVTTGVMALCGGCDPRVGWVGNYVIRRGDGCKIRKFPHKLVNIFTRSLCYSTDQSKRKRKRSDPVPRQKPPHQQKRQKGKVTTQTTPQKSSIKQQLRTDLGRSVGVTTATQLVWLTGLKLNFFDFKLNSIRYLFDRLS